MSYNTDLQSMNARIQTLIEQVNALPEVDSGIDAVPLIDARSADYDMDAIVAGGAHLGFYLTNSTTLGTPYKKGVTAFTATSIFSYSNSADYGIQVAYAAGDKCYVRKLKAGVISDWQAMMDESSATNTGLEIQCGTVDNVGTTGVTVTFPKAFSGIPVVTACGGSETANVRVTDITATGFEVTSGVSNNDGVQWQAIYIS